MKLISGTICLTGVIDQLSNQDEGGVTVDGLREIAGRRDTAAKEPDETPPGFRVQRLSARLSSKQIASAVRRYEEGDSPTTIAKSLDVAPSALTRLLRGRAIVVRKGAASTEQGKQMALEYESGATMTDLEKKYGLPYGVVYRALHRAGVEAQERGHPSKGGRSQRLK